MFANPRMSVGGSGDGGEAGSESEGAFVCSVHACMYDSYNKRQTIAERQKCLEALMLSLDTPDIGLLTSIFSYRQSRALYRFVINAMRNN